MGCVFFQEFIGNKGDVFCKEEFRSTEIQTFETTASDCANGVCLYICQDHVEKTNSLTLTEEENETIIECVNLSELAS